MHDKINTETAIASGRYRVNMHDGQHDFIVEVDLQLLACALANRARKSKKHRATAIDGLVRVTHVVGGTRPCKC
jgi:hypothetical protein